MSSPRSSSSSERSTGGSLPSPGSTSSQRGSGCSSVRSRRPAHSSTGWSVWPGCIRQCRGSACRAAGRSPRRSRLVSSSTRNSITEQRQMKKMIAGIVAAMTITGAAANMGAATTDQDIVDTAVAAGSFMTLAKALQAADLAETLKGAGPFTVFAPTDEAFAKLPAGTLDELLKPENKPKLQRILTSHVVAGKVMAADVVKFSSAKAVSGDTLTIASRDGGVTIGGTNVVKTDIVATNGVIHVIDSVILAKDE